MATLERIERASANAANVADAPVNRVPSRRSCRHESVFPVIQAVASRAARSSGLRCNYAERVASRGRAARCAAARRVRRRPCGRGGIAEARRDQRQVHVATPDGRAARRARIHVRARAATAGRAQPDARRAARSRERYVAAHGREARRSASARRALGAARAAVRDTRADAREPMQHRPALQAQSGRDDSRRRRARFSAGLFAQVPALVSLRVLDAQAPRAAS